MAFCGKISIRFLTNVANPLSVDLSTSRLSRDMSHGLKSTVLEYFVLVSACLMSDCERKVHTGLFIYGFSTVGEFLLDWKCLHLVLIVGHFVARGSRREVKARSGGSIPL